MARSSKDQCWGQYSAEEAKRRFEAALRGAREVGHESMKDISPKRHKPQKPRRETKKGGDEGDV
jgi:hypothetical protein